MVSSTQHGHRDHPVTPVVQGYGRHWWYWYLLPDPLMWPSLIVVHDRGLEETVELLLMQDQEMIQAFSPDA
jgi:hypothetical protein